MTVLWGDDDMVRALGLAGLSCVLVTRPGNAARHSRFVTGIIDDGRPDLPQALLEHAERAAEPPVLFLAEDRALVTVDAHRDRFEDAFRVALAPSGLLHDLLDKRRFQRHAERLGLPVPGAVVVRDGEAGALDGLRAPLIVKPALRDEHWQLRAHGAKALAVSDEAAWERIRPKLAGLGADLVVQEHVPGGEDHIESYHAYVAADGTVLGEFTGRKLRTWPTSFGGSTALVTTDAADVRALGRRTVARLGLTGPLKIDLKRGPDGRLWLFEVNPRFSLWAHLGAVAGVNLPGVAYADLTGQDPAPAPPARTGVKWCNPRLDATAWRERGGSLSGWAAFAMRCNAVSGAQLDDPLPTLARLTRRR